MGLGDLTAQGPTARATEPPIEDFFPISRMLEREVPLSELIDTSTFGDHWRGKVDQFDIWITVKHDPVMDQYRLEVRAFSLDPENSYGPFVWQGWYQCGESTPYDFFEDRKKGKHSPPPKEKTLPPAVVDEWFAHFHISAPGGRFHLREAPTAACQPIPPGEEKYPAPPAPAYERNAGRWNNVVRLDRPTQSYLTFWTGLDIGKQYHRDGARVGLIPLETRLFRRSLSHHLALFGSPEVVFARHQAFFRGRLGLSVISEGDKSWFAGTGRSCFGLRGNHVGNSILNLYGVAESRFARENPTMGWGFDFLSSGYTVGGFFLENTYSMDTGESGLFLGYRYVTASLPDTVVQVIKGRLKS